MQIFIDSADPKEILESLEWGIIDGVTTNPSLAAKVNKPYKSIVGEILSMVSGPVSLETIATDFEGILKEAKALSWLSDNVVVKIPCTQEGYKATKILSKQGIKTNMTLCFSLNQAILAAKVGATYVSPFVGRLDDVNSHSGDELISDIRQVFNNYDYTTQILAASIRDESHVEVMALIGADVVTVPFSILKKLAKHSLTDSGLTKFLDDWKDAGLKLPV